MEGSTNNAVETWAVNDVSQGAWVPSAAGPNNDRLAVGTWVALQPQGGNNWLVGMVRRLSKEDAHAQLGIETLSEEKCRSRAADGEMVAANGYFLLEPPREGAHVHVFGTVSAGAAPQSQFVCDASSVLCRYEQRCVCNWALVEVLESLV